MLNNKKNIKLFLKAILLFIAVLASYTSYAQKSKNLIPNPSFEKHKNKSSDITNAIPWKNVGTVDYYMKPDKKDTSRYKGAHMGTCYAGLRFQPNYKEYMYVQLQDPLEKDEVYHFSMYVRLMGASTVTVKQLGVYFSDFEFKVGMEFNEQNVIDSTYKKGISGTFNWILIQGDYTAHGGEKFVILGNFKTKMKEDFVKRNKWDLFELHEAYYYIDDVSLRKKKTKKDQLDPKALVNKVPPIIPDTFTVGQEIELKGVQFEAGSAKFLKPSYKILDELVHALNDHPFMEIQINGYTDNQGSESTNKKLSKNRAQAVYDYLKTEGVINPMTYKGFGPLKPVAPNDTDENKAKNRRVEMLIIKQ